MENIKDSNQLKPFFRKKINQTSEILEVINSAKLIYQKSVNTLIDHFKNKSYPPDPYPTYPFLGFYIDKNKKSTLDPGLHGVTLTNIDFFEDYIFEQLSNIQKKNEVEFIVGESFEKIPLPYVLHKEQEEILIHADKLSNYIMPNLKRINDDIPNGVYEPKNDLKPLALFNAERIDFSLNRLEHYTRTKFHHFQNFIIFTNYQRYIDGFLKYGLGNKEYTEYTEFIAPDNKIIDKDYIENPPKVLAQMPAYHLKRKDRNGITFINIGVGPSNAKNITDHLAVIRPHCWLMLGHCAGLRRSQVLGDYILAHAYMRDDHVLDTDLPPWIPIPALAEIQQSFEKAIYEICKPNDLKNCLRTGTVLTTDDRNWELKTTSFYEKFKKCRAVAVDMESSTIAANGYRLRVPYGTLLCISDKPIHGELKLKGAADHFYKQQVSQHLEIGLKTIDILRELGTYKLHSRKLRGFDEPLFR